MDIMASQSGTAAIPPPTGNPAPIAIPPPAGSPAPTAIPPPTGNPAPPAIPPPAGSPAPTNVPLPPLPPLDNDPGTTTTHRIVTQSDTYFSTGQFQADIAKFAACKNFGTGFAALDRIQPLYPGLYCLGALPSLGKTTFCVDMADAIAASGRYVLYISLEQTNFELFSKSLASGFFRQNRYETWRNNAPSNYPTPTSIDIRSGRANHMPELADQIDHYISRVKERVIIAHGMFSMTVEEIIGIINTTIEQLHAKPVVFIDYLQIVAPTVVNGHLLDTKASVDHVIHSLKAVQSEHDLTVIAISSLNRQNYLTPLDFESFKESGGIEYSCDVLWGLQLSIINDPSFYNHIGADGKIGKETSLKEKRQMVKDAKAANPRSIELVCLKNRFGISSYSVDFSYYPAHDLFWQEYRPNEPGALIEPL